MATISESFDERTNENSNSTKFQLIWRHMNYKINNSLLTRISRRIQGFKNTPKTKSILRDISGEIKSGELVAFMGPSGAGKSTLMECVVGRRVKGKTGDVFICGENIRNLRISFIAQRNQFLSQLTVRETIYFAARIQMATRSVEGTADDLFDEHGKKLLIKAGSAEYCSILTDNVIKELGLVVCAHNRVTQCSGGQLKRLAMAQELVGTPNILVLDEPTSGLDSASTLQVVAGLRKLAEKNIAVLATIHQPSMKVLNLFHKLYIFSMYGDCIFENSPQLLAAHLEEYGLILPNMFNAADFAMEVASGEHGENVIELLAENHRKIYDRELYLPENRKLIAELNNENLFPFCSHVWTLFLRNTLITLRDPLVFGYRIVSSIGIVFFLTSLFGFEVGRRGGCPPKFDSDFEPSQLDYISEEIEAELKTTYNNIGNLFFCVLFIMFNSLMPTCLGFPKEINAFKIEKQNHWYSLNEFFYELPLQALSVILFWPFAHYIQNQYPETWRAVVVCLLLFLTQIIAQTYGYITGALFMSNIPAAIYLGPCVCILPFILLCGLFIKVKNFQPLFDILSYISYLRFSIEGVLATMYGFGRCQSGKTDLREGRDAFIVWMSAMLGIYNDDSETTQTSANANDSDYTAIGSPSERFVEELIDSIAGDFISKDNVVRSLVMNQFELEE
ncbi:ATP-binding cassette sub-family G member 1-like protein, partial [Leptotrombidium deliense]